MLHSVTTSPSHHITLSPLHSFHLFILSPLHSLIISLFHHFISLFHSFIVAPLHRLAFPHFAFVPPSVFHSAPHISCGSPHQNLLISVSPFHHINTAWCLIIALIRHFFTTLLQYQVEHLHSFSSVSVSRDRIRLCWQWAELQHKHLKPSQWAHEQTLNIMCLSGRNSRSSGVVSVLAAALLWLMALI